MPTSYSRKTVVTGGNCKGRPELDRILRHEIVCGCCFSGKSVEDLFPGCSLTTEYCLRLCRHALPRPFGGPAAPLCPRRAAALASVTRHRNVFTQKPRAPHRRNRPIIARSSCLEILLAIISATHFEPPDLGSAALRFVTRYGSGLAVPILVTAVLVGFGLH